MEQKKSEMVTIQAELKAAKQRIEALEDQLAEIEAINRSLREDHTFRKAVIELASEGICVWHEINTYPFVEFTVWNKRMVEITGYSLNEINRIGWYQAMFPDPEYQARARQRMELMSEGYNLKFEQWEITRTNGEKRMIAFSTSVLTAKDKTTHILGLMHDFTEEERLRTEASQARIDYLTGVKNRRGFYENAGILLKLAARLEQPVTFAYLDVDNLKEINDSLGHSVGDQALKAVGALLLKEIRSTDVVGRLGGDEFAIVLLDMDASDAKIFFKRLHKKLLNILGEFCRQSGASIGIISFTESPSGIDSVIEYADTLMYEAKKNGRNKLVHEVSLDSNNPSQKS